jgi:hypothetical protein
MVAVAVAGVVAAGGEMFRSLFWFFRIILFFF